MLALEKTQFEIPKLTWAVEGNEGAPKEDCIDLEKLAKPFTIVPYTVIPTIKTLLFNMILNVSCDQKITFKRPKKLASKKLLALTNEPEIKKPEIQALPQCKICLMEMKAEDMMTLKTCKHSFHKECAKFHIIQSQEAMNLPVGCPEEGCKETLVEEVGKLLSYDELAAFRKVERKLQCMRDPYLYKFCPTPDCEYIFTIDYSVNVQECEMCLKKYCTQCGLLEHVDMTCAEAEEAVQDDIELLEVIQDAKLKRCPECRFYIERYEGCHHMTCSCGHEFCFLCGEVWQTCECSEDT